MDFGPAVTIFLTGVGTATAVTVGYYTIKKQRRDFANQRDQDAKRWAIIAEPGYGPRTFRVWLQDSDITRGELTLDQITVLSPEGTELSRYRSHFEGLKRFLLNDSTPVDPVVWAPIYVFDWRTKIRNYGGSRRKGTQPSFQLSFLARVPPGIPAQTCFRFRFELVVEEITAARPTRTIELISQEFKGSEVQRE